MTIGLGPWSKSLRPYTKGLESYGLRPKLVKEGELDNAPLNPKARCTPSRRASMFSSIAVELVSNPKP